jgi:hypothetical protein
MIQERRVIARQGEGAMSYFANVVRPGPIGYHQAAGSIAVFGRAADSEPIGIAHCINWGGEGFALWELTVRGGRLEGPWLLADGAFIAARGPAGRPR